MRRLGASIYPDKSTKEEVINYLHQLNKIGAKRIFTCLLSVEKTKDEIKKEFLEIHQVAKQLGLEIIFDVSPAVFKDLNISYDDLSFFKELLADGIRLDLGFTGIEESLMTFNEYDLKIELNMSNNTHYLDNIMAYQPNKYNLIGCHNFYPHNYSALGLDFFQQCNKRYKKYNLHTAAFITSQAPNSFGPWPVTQGLPTLEMHRHLPIDVQLKHYVVMDEIDDILISNCYPTSEELAALGKVDLNLLNLEIETVSTLSEVEKSIIFDELHFNRGDISENLIRSTMPRVKHKGTNFPIHNPVPIIKRGDVVIESSEYGHYAGEMQIALTDMENSGKSNVVGRIREEEIFLLDYLKPWQKFKITQTKK